MFSIGGTSVSADFTNSGWAYGQWNFVAITYDGSYIRGYVNGHLVGMKAQTGTLDSYPTPVDIGGYANLAKDSTYLFKGGIADVAIYSTALGEDKLQSDYSYGFASTSSSTASTPYTRSVMADSPVAFWRSDESAGPYMRDFTSGGNDMIASSGVSFAQPGSIATDDSDSVTLDGSSGFAEAPPSSSLNAPSSQITMEAWVHPDASGSWTQAPIVLKSYTSQTPPYYQYGMALSDTTSFPDDLVAKLSIGGTSVSADFTNSGWAYGKWNFVAITYNGSSIRGYVNGQLIGTQAQSGTIDSYPTPIDIGAYANVVKDSTYLFKGGIDDVAIYSISVVGEADRCALSRVWEHAAAGRGPADGCRGADWLRMRGRHRDAIPGQY